MNTLTDTRSLLHGLTAGTPPSSRLRIAEILNAALVVELPAAGLEVAFERLLGGLDGESMLNLSGHCACPPTRAAMRAVFAAADDAGRRGLICRAATEAARQHHQLAGDLDPLLYQALALIPAARLARLAGLLARVYAFAHTSPN